MGIVHCLRNQNTAVFGMATDLQIFYFLQVDNDSNWFTHVVISPANDFKRVIPLLTHIILEAAKLSSRSL
ncbi:hypothetical protein VI817_005287 [Penicillium citrinum]|nr:hypothetical protein VI817_005287 [Penicillium citrinum]